MTSEEFQTIGLYDHNADSYRMVRNAYESGKNIAGIVHATGTGKSYNALQLAYDNKDKKIIYVVPSNGIIEHIKKIIEDNPNLDMRRDFPNLEFRTYQSFISLDEEEISSIDCDLLILDEFHHIGAPVWGARINTMIETHPNMKIFGMTAYTVRDRGTSYERDMANPDTDELFSGKIESRYDLCDAMIDGVLPKPVYKSAYTNLIGLESKLEERVQKLNATSREYQEYMAILSDVKRRIHEAPSISNILRKNIKQNGKYIYFCPPCSEEGTNDIETIKHQAIEWFKQFVPEEDIIIYTSTSDMGEDGKLNRDAFYDDVTLEGEKADNKLRVMFAINQYNEGIHAPNIDGVIMGRGTTSDIVYFEQLGRALSVRGNTKEMFDELEKYSIEELLEMCKSRDIPVKENTAKEELIEKLIAPVVIDLTNNYEFIKKLENNLRDRIKDIQTNGLGSHRDVKIRDASFDIEIENQDLFEMLRYVSDRLTMTWEDYYELAKAYYEHHGNLLIPREFKTSDGYTTDENGAVNLGHWISDQRNYYDNISFDRKQKLQQIGFVLNVFNARWETMYKLAKIYYDHYKNLNVPQIFKTINGYEYDENGVNLGNWISVQRRNYEKLSGEKQLLLEQISFASNILDTQWQDMYELARKYYEHHGDSLIVGTFKTINGYEYDENGANLGNWISAQRGKYNSLSDDRKEKLARINFVVQVNDYLWNNYYELAKKYYEHYGNLLIPSIFKTVNGYEIDSTGIDLGNWLSQQKSRYNRLTDDRKQKLQQIGFVISRLDDQWEKMYELAKTYYQHYGNSEIGYRFKTINGYDEDINGVSLGQWLGVQRRNFDTLDDEKKQKLSNIEIRLENKKSFISWEEMFELAKKYYFEHNDLRVPQKYVTEEGIRLGSWIANQRNLTSPNSEKGQLLLSIGMIWKTKKNKEEIDNACIQHNIDKNKNKTILSRISIQELQSKIEFLKAHNIPIVDENGLLIDIFSMSSPDMKEKYGISLEEIISEYYIKNQMGKGV